MTDPSPISPDFPGPQQQLARLLQIEVACPICQRVVLSISGNELRYLTDHTHDVTDPSDYVGSTDQGTYVSFRIYHKNIETGDVGPGWIHLPNDAFLILQSLTVRPNETQVE